MSFTELVPRPRYWRQAGDVASAVIRRFGWATGFPVNARRHRRHNLPLPVRGMGEAFSLAAPRGLIATYFMARVLLCPWLRVCHQDPRSIRHRSGRLLPMSVLATFPTWWGNASSCVKSGGCRSCQLDANASELAFIKACLFFKCKHACVIFSYCMDVQCVGAFGCQRRKEQFVWKS